MFTKIFNWIVARLSEGTTWGAAALLTALGLNLDEANAVIAAVVSLLAAIRIFLPEKRGDAAPAEG